MPSAVDIALPRPFPERIVHSGRSVTLEPLSKAHVAELWEAAAGAEASWSYLRYGPFATAAALGDHVRELASRPDQPFWAVRPATTGTADGWLSLCDVYPADGAIEIGSVWYSPRLQRTRAATEAVVLLMRHAFDDLGYQRLVWRCNAGNRASMRAAERYGFVPEGVWRCGIAVRGELRDVAWHSMLVEEWPRNRDVLEAWLDDGNFDADGAARRSVDAIRRG